MVPRIPPNLERASRQALKHLDPSLGRRTYWHILSPDYVLLRIPITKPELWSVEALELEIKEELERRIKAKYSEPIIYDVIPCSWCPITKVLSMGIEVKSSRSGGDLDVDRDNCARTDFSILDNI